MEKIGERKTAAYKEAVEQSATLEKKMNEYRQQNKEVQDKLNSTIEAFEDKFTDTSNVVEYDISRLEKKYINASSSSTTTNNNNSRIPCFVEQIDITSCLNNKNKSEKLKDDPFACDVFIQALTDCTDKTITTKKEETQ